MIRIAGAGMAGLLAANMLHRMQPLIFEKQPSLPNNHSALLRFRTPDVGNILGIPFKKVQVIKTVAPWRNGVADALAYSFKNTGVYRSDRSIGYGTETVERWIAPEDLIAQMAAREEIAFNTYCAFRNEEGPIISTIPMPDLMKALSYPNVPKFEYRKGWNIQAKVKDCDAYASISFPSPQIFASRASITGDRLIIECYKDVVDPPSIAHYIANQYFGIELDPTQNIEMTLQPYAKLLPIPEGERRAFLVWATQYHRIYSLGRFATWRPGLLLDDLIKDIRLIEGWINHPDHYSISRRR